MILESLSVSYIYNFYGCILGNKVIFWQKMHDNIITASKQQHNVHSAFKHLQTFSQLTTHTCIEQIIVASTKMLKHVNVQIAITDYNVKY